MSTIQQAAANTTLRIANLFEQNCAFKHGLPKVGGPDRVEEPKPEPEAAPVVSQDLAALLISKIGNTPATTKETLTPGAEAATAGSSLLRKAAPFLLAAALPGAGAIGYGVASMMGEPETTIIQQPVDGDLLQYLQSRGDHLPGGEPWTK